MSLLLRAHLRYFWRHPWLPWLGLLGVALGVAVVVSVDLAGHSALRSFELSSAAVAGRSTHRILGVDGVPDELYRQLRVERGLRRSAPVVEGFLRLNTGSLRVLGLDPLAEGPFRDFGLGQDLPLGVLLAEPSSVLLTESTARDLHLEPGSTLPLPAGRAVVRGLLVVTDERTQVALADTVLCDVSVAQELLGQKGLSRIDLILEPDEVEPVRSLLPPGTELVPASAEREAALGMSRTFQLNLQALSLLSLAVGLFLIYNIVSFAAVHRQAHFGRLRTLGVLRAELFWTVVLEALVLGLAGAVLGLALGILLGGGLVHLVARTIDEFYHRAQVQRVLIEPWVLAKGASVGVLGAALAAIPGGLQATRALPGTSFGRSSLESRARRLAPRAALGGLALFGVGGLLLRFGPPTLVPALLAAFCLLLGAALITPWQLSLAVGWAHRLLSPRLGLLGRLALRGVQATLSRTGVAAAALAVAVSLAVGTGVMVDSFRSTLVEWLDFTLQADLYLTTPGIRADSEGSLPRELAGQLRQLPGVEAVSTNRSRTVPSQYGAMEINALDPAAGYRKAFRFLGTPHEVAWTRFDRGEVFLSEPSAHRHGLRAGDTLWLLTPRGRRKFPVGAVVSSYSPTPAVLWMSRDAYDRAWEDPEVTGLGIHLGQGGDSGALVRRLRRLFPEVQVTPTARIKELSLEIFDRTFEVTRVLQLLALCVAFVGIVTALMALQLERAREVAVMRALGLTPGQVYGLSLWQSGLMGLFCGLLAIPYGLALAWVMIEFVNQRAFGWTLSPEVTAPPLLLAPALGLAAALLGGLYPAAVTASQPPAVGLRAE